MDAIDDRPIEPIRDEWYSLATCSHSIRKAHLGRARVRQYVPTWLEEGPHVEGNMANTVIKPLHWNMILDGIHEGSCVPFLGAAVNISNDFRKYKGLPVGGEVALRLIELLIDSKVERIEELAQVTGIKRELQDAGLDKDLARLGFVNLPRVALHVEVESLGKRAYLMERLRTILADKECEPSKLLVVLAHMPFRLIVTTNFDRLLERALERAVEESWRIAAADIKDPKGLALHVRQAKDPVSQHLKARLSASTRETIEAYDARADPAETLIKGLANDLNQLVTGDSLFEEQRFKEVNLANETRDLIAQNPSGKERTRLNRILLEEAYPLELVKSRRPCKLVVQPIDGFKGAEQAEQLMHPPSDDVTVVYKIHGTFHDEKSHQQGASTSNGSPAIVLTEEDYIRFLTVLGQSGAGVPNYITSKMVRSSLLFLGYSLEDWDFRTLYRGLIERLPADTGRTAFAIQWNTPKFWVDYWKLKGVEIYDYDVYDFAEELETRYVTKFGSLGSRKDKK